MKYHLQVFFLAKTAWFVLAVIFVLRVDPAGTFTAFYKDHQEKPIATSSNSKFMKFFLDVLRK
jgi:hypothetical protein